MVINSINGKEFLLFLDLNLDWKVKIWLTFKPNLIVWIFTIFNAFTPPSLNDSNSCQIIQFKAITWITCRLREAKITQNTGCMWKYIILFFSETICSMSFINLRIDCHSVQVLFVFDYCLVCFIIQM